MKILSTRSYIHNGPKLSLQSGSRSFGDGCDMGKIDLMQITNSD
ncbi:MAG: hypothetical protein ACOH1X_01700 [Kaistella sp.]